MSLNFQLPKMQNYPTPIPVVEQCKYLGIIFDKILTFIAHIIKNEEPILTVQMPENSITTLLLT